jgi:hypothetical protein
MTHVERLFPYSNSKSTSGSYKFKLGCQERLTKDTPTTQEWLQLSNQFLHASDDYKIYEGLLEKRKNSVAKVGTSTKLLEEYEKAKQLSTLKLRTIISFYCVFTCNDTFSNLGSNTRYLCNNATNDTITVLVMPFLQMGQIDKYKWTRENVDIFKSVIKHIICSLLYAFEKCCFAHRDMHFGNILLKKTTVQVIEYGAFTLQVYGMIPVIMDFERSFVQKDNTNCFMVYEDIRRVLNLARSEIDVKLNINNDLPQKYIMKNTPVCPKVYIELCEYIDSLKIDYVSSEMMKLFNLQQQ